MSLATVKSCVQMDDMKLDEDKEHGVIKTRINELV